MEGISHLKSSCPLPSILEPLVLRDRQSGHEVPYAWEALGVEGVGWQAMHLQVLEAVPGRRKHAGQSEDFIWREEEGKVQKTPTTFFFWKRGGWQRHDDVACVQGLKFCQVFLT